MWSRSELKSRAKEILNANYWKAVLVSLIFSFVGGGGGGSSSASSSSSGGDPSTSSGSFTSPDELRTLFIGMTVIFIVLGIIIIFSLVLSIFVFNPLYVGCQRYFVLCGKQPASFDEVVFAFSHSYLNIVKIMFFKSLYTFLWSLLLIIPGIIKGYEYRMIPYLLAENPNIDMKEAFSLTKQMMDGDKANAWVLDLSFIGWNLLGALTCCILSIFYVNPYQNLTNAQLYEVLKIKISGPSDAGYRYQETSAEDQTVNPYL